MNNSNWFILGGFLIIALAIVVSFAFFRPTFNVNTNTQNPGLTVSDYGEAYGKPDIALVELGVRTDGRTATQAQSKNSETSKKIKEALAKEGIEEKDIQTISYYINPIYDYRSGTARITGYETYHMLRVKVRNLDKTDSVLTASTTAGANQISGVQFTLEDMEALKDEARQRAFEKAKAKAVSIAKEANVNLGSVIAVSEYFPSDTTPLLSDGRGGGEAAPQIQSGELTVRVEVNLTYAVS